MKFKMPKIIVAAILCIVLMSDCILAAELTGIDTETAASLSQESDTPEVSDTTEATEQTEAPDTTEQTEATGQSESIQQTDTVEAPETERETMDSEETAETETEALPESETMPESEYESEQDLTAAQDSEVSDGLVTDDNGNIYYYINGEKFTDGYKEVADEDGNISYYYFQEDGTAFTDGYKSAKVDGHNYFFYFQKNGQAFTDGLLEFVHTNGKTYYYYFQSNGQAFTGGYKGINSRYYSDGKNPIIKIKDSKTYFYYFQSNGQAYNKGFLEFVHTNGKTYYYYFQTNGQAFTGGYKGINKRAYTDGKSAVSNINDNKTYYYYFQTNGQAYNKGFLEFVHTNGKTYYYYFQTNGQAFTGGYKGINKRAYTDGKSAVSNIDDSRTYYYYFQTNGQAYNKGFLEFVHTNGKTYYYYFQTNGQAFTGGYKGINKRAYTDGKSAVKNINDNKTYYYYFQTNGQAFNKGFLKFIHTNGKTYFYYFQPNGQAFTSGYKAVSVRAYTDGKSAVKTVGDRTQYHYYFQANGQAYTKGYLKFVHTNGKTYIFYFQSNGQAYTKGWITANNKKYYFDGKGHAYTGLQTIDGTRYYFNKSTGALEWKNRKYQNPSGYYQIQDSITLKGGGYDLSVGYEGLKTAYVIRKLGLGNGIGMGGAYYSNSVASAVKSFQARNGLNQTGKVNLATWKAMGFTEKQWYTLGGYASPVKVTPYSSKEDCIEIMIDRAYDYLGDDYIIGASGAPGEGLDCSGLVMQALYAAGIDMSPINPVRHASPGYEYESRNIWTSSKLKHVSYSDRKRGDIIIYCSSSGTVIHSAIYLGNDKIIESWPNSVQVSSLIDSRHPYVKGVLRVFN